MDKLKSLAKGDLAMPWSVKGKVELRAEFVKRALSGEAIARLCREYGISRPTGYLWLNRFESAGTIRSLLDRSHRPKSCPRRTSKEVEQYVIKLREQYGWGADKLKVLLLQRHQVDLPRVTINRIIERNGLLIAEDCIRPALKRFQRETPNELWQVDLKGCVGRGEARCEPLSMLDDCSRFVVGLFPTTSSKLEPIQAAFTSVFRTFGVPQALLMDHGVPWWGNAHFSGLTRLSVWLMRQDIRLCFSGYNHPQTQGKVERFHRTLAHAIRHKGTPRVFRRWGPLLAQIRNEYNTVRPHESLDMQVPASRYSPSAKAFNPIPSEPQYPLGSMLLKVEKNGTFKFKKKRLFASQALSGETVRLVELENSLAVFYRNTPLREVDLRTGQSVPFLDS